jgi:hypothetical protein
MSVGETWRILSTVLIGRAKRRLVMAKVIEFYIPAKFRKRVHWVPVEQRGQVIEFYLQVQKPA